MKEEENILKKLSSTNSFKVPEGYFENFTTDLMSKLPEKENVDVTVQPSMWTKIRPYLYMAAMFIGAALIIQVASFHLSDTEKKADDSVAEKEQVQDQMLDAAVDRAMLDDYALYVYLNESSHD